MQDAESIFEAELRKRSVAFSGPDSDGLYKVQTERGELTVSLDNISRNHERDGDPESVVRFVDQVLSTFVLPTWDRAQSLVYFSAEPSDHDFGETVRRPVSDGVAKVLVLTDLKEGKITWLTPADLAKWNVSQDQIEQAASGNLSRLLDDKRLEVEEIDGMKLAMVPVESVFKASVIFASDFKSFVTNQLEWPVLVVIPCRDFIYVLSEKDKALLNRMGAVVQREYWESGYPITTEVLRISDEGIKAIGEFPKK
jgi:uncharacterized protein YtpQ (UPF0354 family)